MIPFISLTRKELFRKKILIITLILTVLFLLLFGYGLSLLTKITQQADPSLYQNYLNGLLILYFGLFFIELMTGFFVFFMTMGAISGDLESGILLSIVPRPIPRWRYYLGKWAGYAFWCVIYSALLYVIIFLLVHQFMGFPLSAAAMIHGVLLFILIPLTLLSVSMLGSVIFPMLGNGIFCALIFLMTIFIGFVNNLVNSTQVHPSILEMTMAVNFLLPANAIFERLTYDLMNVSFIPKPLLQQLGPFSHVQIINGAFVVYALCYIVVMLAIGCLVFSKKDI